MIKFLEVKRAYYNDPENVRVRVNYSDGIWHIIDDEPSWNDEWEYGIAPRTIRIGDIEVPEPVVVDHDLFAREKLATEFCNQRMIDDDEPIRPMIIDAFCSGYAIPAAELATLREKAAMVDELRKRLAAYDRLNKELDAAIAQGKGE